MASVALARKPAPLLRLLLVEDNASDAFLLGSLLEESGDYDYEVTLAPTQGDAIFLLAEKDFDACLLDLTLPDASGFSALITIQEKAPQMPVLILTGMKDAALAKSAVGRGAQDYLLKDELAAPLLLRSIDYAIERKRMEKNLFLRANFDDLTGLANRAMLESRLAMALQRSERIGSVLALLYIDLDGFKRINDQYGHDAGDTVLKAVALRLQQALRAYDTPARLGGDEFAALLEDIATPRDVATIAQKLLAAITAPIPYYRNQLHIGASVGIVCSNAPVSQAEMLHHADAAMYRAKREGGGYRFYSPELHGIAESRLKLEEDICNAVEAGELRLHYQPYFSGDGETLLGVETLLRWVSAAHGMVPPHEFLPAAEARQLMPAIGAWMGAQLQRDIARWNIAMLPPMQIALNLTISQLDDSELMRWLSPLLCEDFLGDHTLAAELAEEALLQLTPRRLGVLGQLKAMGMALHLDHFGAQNLSLQSLSALPFSLLKMDPSLIDPSGDELLLRAAILLAHQLDMQVAAVGIESRAQLHKLQALHCDMAQGFLTAAPMTAEALVAWLKARAAKIA